MLISTPILYNLESSKLYGWAIRMSKKLKLFFFTDSSIPLPEEEFSALLDEGWKIEAFRGRPSERKCLKVGETPVYFGTIILSREVNDC